MTGAWDPVEDRIANRSVARKGMHRNIEAKEASVVVDRTKSVADPGAEADTATC